MSQADTVIVLDFETTGLSPDMGDRAIEIGAVRINNGRIEDSFQALMNPGFRISGFIEQYTGITNAMLAQARSCSAVMAEFACFIEGYNLVAHNASFDQRFLDAEFHHIQHQYAGEFSCSLLATRRIYPQAPNHKLGTLVEYMNLPNKGQFHRALYDAQMTANVWLHMLNTLENEYNLSHIPFTTIQKLNKTAKKSVPNYLNRLRGTA